MHWRTLLFLVLPVALWGAGDAPLDRATLRGLTSVGVIVDQLDPVLANEGVSRESIQTRLAQHLQDSGITVESKANEFVALRVNHVRGNRGPYAVSITIGVYQPVMLARDHTLKTATQTWEVETVLMADSKQLYRAFLNTVDELADRFVSAWRSVNPKPAP